MPHVVAGECERSLHRLVGHPPVAPGDVQVLRSALEKHADRLRFALADERRILLAAADGRIGADAAEDPGKGVGPLPGGSEAADAAAGGAADRTVVARRRQHDRAAVRAGLRGDVGEQLVEEKPGVVAAHRVVFAAAVEPVEAGAAGRRHPAGADENADRHRHPAFVDQPVEDGRRVELDAVLVDVHAGGRLAVVLRGNVDRILPNGARIDRALLEPAPQHFTLGNAGPLLGGLLLASLCGRRRCGGCCGSSRRFLDAVKRLVGAEVEGTADGGGSGHDLSVERVCRLHEKALARPDHERLAVAVADVDPPVGEDGRGGKVATQPLRPDRAAGLGVEAGGDPLVADDIELVPHDQWRGNARRPLLLAPGDRRRRLAVAEPERQQHRLREARAHEDQPVRRHGPRHDREAQPLVADSPEFPPAGWIVAVDPVGRGGDEHVAAARRHHQRRAVCLAEVGVVVGLAAAVGLPGDAARLRVEGDEILHVAAVAVENEPVLPEHGRAAWAVLVVEPLLAVDPRHPCRMRVDAGRAEIAEMAVEAAVREDRRGRGVGIEAVDRLRFVDDEQFDVVEQAARVAIEAEGMEAHRAGHAQRIGGVLPGHPLRLFLGGNRALDGGGQPDLVPLDHGRRPAAAGQGGFPGDVLRFAPLDGQVVRGLGVALARRPPPLRPIRRVGSGRQQDDRRQEAAG